ncbi:MAG: MFS transporter [Candidatus Hydrothermarchaeaceae archaeon]
MKLYKHKNLQVVFGVTLMAVIGVALIAPAFPRMAEVLGVSKASIGLLITAFTLPGVFLATTVGVLSDRYGRKKVLIPSLLLFGLAGGACAFTRDFKVLVLLRVFQGIGASGLASLGTTLIGDIYEGRERADAMGYNASVLSMGTASYPFIGGVLASIAWYYPFYVFFIAIPIGLIVLLYLENPEPEHRPEMRGYLKGALKSVLNLKAAGAFGAGVLTFIFLYGAYLTYFPILLAEAFHAGPFIIGVLLSAMSITTAIVSSQSGRISSRISQATAIKIAFLLYGLALLILPLMDRLWLFLLPAMIFGTAMGLNIPALMTLVAGLAPTEQRGAVMSINATMLRIGQTLGPPVAGLAFLYLGIKGVFYSIGILAVASSMGAIAVGYVTKDAHL